MMSDLNPNNIEFGDYVLICKGVDSGISGRVISVNPEIDRAAIDRSWSPGGGNPQIFSWHVILSELRIIEKNTLVNLEAKFTKEDLLQIIDQDKTAEEVVLDLKDHITN